MKSLISILLIAAVLTPFARAVNNLQGKATATAPALDDWLYLAGDTNDVRKLSPSYFVSAATAATTYAPVVHTHAASALTQSGATTGQVMTWNGSAWGPAAPSGGAGSGAANLISATPSGSSGAAVLRSMVTADLPPIAVASFVFDGSGAVVPAGQITNPRPCPFGFTVTGYTIVGDISGSITVDVLMATGGSSTFNSITASAKPALSSSRRLNSSTLTGWTTVVPNDSELEASISGTPATLTKCTLVLYGRYN